MSGWREGGRESVGRGAAAAKENRRADGIVCIGVGGGDHVGGGGSSGGDGGRLPSFLQRQAPLSHPTVASSMSAPAPGRGFLLRAKIRGNTEFLFD